jgi:phage FluMu protein Com
MSPAFIDVRCQHCAKLLCQVSKDFFGVVILACRRCQKKNVVSLAVILKQMDDTCDKLPVPAQVSA